MLKKPHTYENWDGKTVTENLYFNVTKIELTENLQMMEELERLQELVGGEPRTLEVSEVQRILDFVKLVMRLSYGVRSDDGKRFIKNDQVWEEFTQTAAYDTLLFDLFTGKEDAMDFVLNIMPNDLRQAAAAEVQNRKPAPLVVPQELQTETVTAPVLEKPAADAPKKFDDYTKDELMAMSDEEFQKLLDTPLPHNQLLIAYERKNRQQ